MGPEIAANGESIWEQRLAQLTFLGLKPWPVAALETVSSPELRFQFAALAQKVDAIISAPASLHPAFIAAGLLPLGKISLQPMIPRDSGSPQP